MKNILLIAQGASSSQSVIAEAAINAGRGLRHASNSHDAFETLADNLEEIEVIIVDVDPGIQGLSVLDAISYRETHLPVIVITAAEEEETASMAYRHGATACIGSGFTARELAALIEDVCLPKWRQCGGSCDRWGHPCERHRHHPKPGHAYEHVYSMSI